MKTTRLCLLLAVAAHSGTSLHAASITWGAPQSIANDSDVSTNGTLVAAYHFGGPGLASTVVNGVTFQPFPLDGTSNTVTIGNATVSAANPLTSTGTGTWQTLSLAYTDLLASALTLRADSGRSLELAGLTVGETYEFETWVSNSQRLPNGGGFLFPAIIDDGLGNSVSLYPGDNGGGLQAARPGEFVIGTFTATATTQTINYLNEEIDGPVNAFQLRRVATPVVPEPGTALFGLALLGATGCTRRRSAKS